MSLAGAILELIGQFVVEVVWHFACYGVGKGVLVAISLGRWTTTLDGVPPPGPEEERARHVDPDLVRLLGMLTLVLAIAACVLAVALR